MKSLEQFKLEIPKDHIIVTFYPQESEITSLIVEPSARGAKFIAARPAVVALSNLSDGVEGLKPQVGDFVFLKEEHVHSAMLLGKDEERRWKNPIIVPVYSIGAILRDEEQITYYKEHYDVLAEKMEASIVARNERMKSKAKIIK
jgi:hypothetical protein